MAFRRIAESSLGRGGGGDRGSEAVAAELEGEGGRAATIVAISRRRLYSGRVRQSRRMSGHHQEKS